MSRAFSAWQSAHSGWTAVILWSAYEQLAATSPLNIDGVREADVREGAEAWSRAVFRVTPLRRTKRTTVPDTDQKLLWHTFDRGIILLCESRNTLVWLLEHEVAGAFQPRLRQFGIDVDGMVRATMDAPTRQWTLSSAHARSPGEGAALKVMSFYGRDISESGMVRALAPDLLFFSCTLRHVEHGDVAALNGDGFIACLGKVERQLPLLGRIVRRLATSERLLAGKDARARRYDGRQ